MDRLRIGLGITESVPHRQALRFDFYVATVFEQ
jgi:hypothetical protein